MQFAEGQLYGRAAAVMMPLFRERAGGKNLAGDVSQEMVKELKWAMFFLKEAAPRTLEARDPRRPAVICTDGALEGDQKQHASIGAVLFDEAVIEYFGIRVPSRTLAAVQKETKNVIAALEVVAVASALRLWRKRLRNRRVFIFVDNEAAKAALIKMATNVPSMRVALEEVVGLAMTDPCYPWYARVASPCNPADAPSRLKPLEVGGSAAVKREVNLDWLDKRTWKKGRREE